MIFQSTISLPNKRFFLQKVLMTSLHVVWPPNQKLWKSLWSSMLVLQKKTATFGSPLKEILPPLEQCSSSGAARELIFLYGYVFKIQITLSPNSIA